MIAIIDYEAGNSRSVKHATDALNINAELISDAQQIDNASKIILPGVGSADATISSLKNLKILDAIENAVLRKKVPFSFSPLSECKISFAPSKEITISGLILFPHIESKTSCCLALYAPAAELKISVSLGHFF